MDDSTTSSKSSSKRLKELEQTMKKAFSQFKVKQEESSDDEQSHFQFFQFLHTNQVSLQSLHDQVAFKQLRSKLSNPNLCKILLVKQSTMSLFCNKKLVSNLSVRQPTYAAEHWRFDECEQSGGYWKGSATHVILQQSHYQYPITQGYHCTLQCNIQL